MYSYISAYDSIQTYLYMNIWIRSRILRKEYSHYECRVRKLNRILNLLIKTSPSKNTKFISNKPKNSKQTDKHTIQQKKNKKNVVFRPFFWKWSGYALTCWVYFSFPHPTVLHFKIAEKLHRVWLLQMQLETVFNVFLRPFSLVWEEIKSSLHLLHCTKKCIPYTPFGILFYCDSLCRRVAFTSICVCLCGCVCLWAVLFSFVFSYSCILICYAHFRGSVCFFFEFYYKMLVWSFS